MIKHIVLFQMKAFSTEEEKQEKLKNLKRGLESLDGKIPGLLSIEVGININPAEQYDLALTTTFSSMSDLHAYAIHPEHMAVAVKIREVLEKRACVDFEY